MVTLMSNILIQKDTLIIISVREIIAQSELITWKRKTITALDRVEFLLTLILLKTTVEHVNIVLMVNLPAQDMDNLLNVTLSHNVRMV